VPPRSLNVGGKLLTNFLKETVSYRYVGYHFDNGLLMLFAISGIAFAFSCGCPLVGPGV
jgi:hypothetical protein